uniref:Sulfotransferase n=1 Tax=Zea mays TaxID=4577 RepID=A0A804M1W9_MAIZE
MAQAASGSSKIDTKAPTSADEAAQPKSYGDLVSTLPARGGWVSLVQYQNYWLNPGRLQNIIPVKELYKPRADDIVLATYLKCGTTWLKALAFAITTRGRHHQAFAAADHPLLTVHPQEAVPHLEVHTPGQGLADIERLPSPRLLGTHLPLSLLPPAVATSGCRVVYLCRQPKDVFVSLWHFVKGMRGGRSPVELDAALAMFCEGVRGDGGGPGACREDARRLLRRPVHRRGRGARGPGGDCEAVQLRDAERLGKQSDRRS